MSDVIAKATGCIIPATPMNGETYTAIELASKVGGEPGVVVLANNKALVYDQDGKQKGKLPNRIATGWLLMDGYDDYLVGDVMLIDRKHIG